MNSEIVTQKRILRTLCNVLVSSIPQELAESWYPNGSEYTNGIRQQIYSLRNNFQQNSVTFEYITECESLIEAIQSRIKNVTYTYRHSREIPKHLMQIRKIQDEFNKLKTLTQKAQ